MSHPLDPLTPMQKAIGSIAFLAPLDTDMIARLSAISLLKELPKEYILHYENSYSDRLLFLVDGLAKAYKIDKYDNEIFLYYIYPGKMLSDLSSLEDPRLLSYANVSTVEPTRLLSIDYKQFKTKFLDSGILSRPFTSEILRQSRLLRELIDREFLLDSVSKVAMMLDKDLEMFNRLRRHDVSMMLHIQPETLSRVLKRLKRDDLVCTEKGEVMVCDHERLQTIYKDSL